MTAPAKRMLGKIEFSGKDIPTQPARYDRIAVDRGNKILLVSLVAESQYVKAIRAILNGNVRCQITAVDGKVAVPDAAYCYPSNPGNLHPTEESYECYTQKLDFGLVHALFVTRMPGFMPVLSHDSLWRELSDTRFTTPMLRGWLPYIESKLKEQDLLTLASSFNFPYQREGDEEPEVMRCGVLMTTVEQLDLIVTQGIQGGHLSIPGGTTLDPADEEMPVISSYSMEQAEEDGVIQVFGRPATGSFKVGALVSGEKGPNFNGCRYRTRDEAEAAAKDLYSRWTMMTGYEIHESDDEPNC